MLDLISSYNRHNAFGKANNLTLKVLNKGEIEYKMKLDDQHFALPGVIHGGAIAGLMDAVLSVAAFSMVSDEGKYVATVEFKINYLKPVKSIMELTGIGTVIKNGKNMIITKGEILNEDQELVAIGTGTILSYHPKS